MNISQESTGDLTATLKIEIEKADYASRVEEKIKEYRKKMKMPGFREGKIPTGLVHKMYGKTILAEEINNLISDALQKHLEENNIQTLASPLPNKEKQQTIDFDTQEIFSFYFDIAIKPEFKLDIEGLEGIKLYSIEPDEKSVNEYIEHIQKSFGTFEDTVKVEPDSLIHCDIEEVNDIGENLEGSKQVHSHMMVDKIADEEIRNRVMGAAVGDVIRMNPMKAFQNKTEVISLLEMKGKELPDPMNDYDFHITKILRRVPAAIDEKLLAEVFTQDKLKDEQELRERVKQDITVSYEKEAMTRMFNDALDAMLLQSALQLPDEFMKRWLLENREEEKLSPEDFGESYEVYARQLRIALIRNRLIEDYQLQVTEDDFTHYIRTALGADDPEDPAYESKMAAISNILANMQKDHQQMERIGDRILEQKISDLIMQKVPYTTVTVSPEEFTAFSSN